LYLGQSARYFELQPGMTWPDGSWMFSRILGETGTRNLANALLFLAAISLVVGGIGIFTNQAWWRQVVAGAAVFSTVMYCLLWDGVIQNLANKGGVGILINLAILVALIVFK
jgi:hypothetical protein